MNTFLASTIVIMLTVLGLHNIGWMVWGGLSPEENSTEQINDTGQNPTNQETE